MRRALLLAGFALSACLEGTAIRAEAPSEVEWVGLVRISEGVVVQATGLRPTSDPSAIAYPSTDGSTLVLLGFREGDLRAAAGGMLPDADVLREATLHSPGPCEPELPAPVWSQVVRADGSAVPLEVEPPRVSANWLLDACTGLPDLGIEIECAESWCDRTISANGACGALVELGACAGLPNVSVMADAESRVCMSDASSAGGYGPSSEISVETALGPCVFRAHRFEHNTVDFDPVDFIGPLGWAPRPLEPKALRGEDELESTAIYAFPIGFASDFLLLPDRAIVAAARQPNYRACAEAPNPEPTTLAVFDLDGRFMPEATATVAPCLAHLLPDLGGDGFWAAHGAFRTATADEREISIVHYALDGRVLDSIPVIVPGLNAHLRDFALVGQRIFITTELGDDGKLGGLVRIDLQTREIEIEIQDATPRAIRLAFLTPLGDAGLALIDDGVNTIVLRDNTGTIPIGATGMPAMDLARPYFDPATQIILLSGRDSGSGGKSGFIELSCLVAGQRFCYQPAQFFYEDHQLLSIVPWPGRSDALAVFVGLQSGDHISTSLTRLNIETRHYEPSLAPLAESMVSKAQVDRNGVIWALVPEEGQLLRIRLPPSSD